MVAEVVCSFSLFGRSRTCNRCLRYDKFHQHLVAVGHMVVGTTVLGMVAVVDMIAVVDCGSRRTYKSCLRNGSCSTYVSTYAVAVLNMI